MTKRLICWLTVFAVALTMAPAIKLPAITAKAAENNPGENAIASAATVIADAKALGAFPVPGEGEQGVTRRCPSCKTEKVWLPIDSTADTKNLVGHYYLVENITTGISVLSGDRQLCLNLNGKNITAGPEALSFANSTMWVMDTVGTGVVTGVGGAALYLNGAKAGGTANIYGGTYTKSDSATTSVLSIGGNGGTVNFYAGVIDAGSITNDAYPTALSISGSKSGTNAGKATVNMYGGRIIGGTASGSGGTMRIGSGTSSDAEFNLYGGTISGGKTTGSSGNSGGSIYVNAAQLNVYGGEITGGIYERPLAILGGGNIALAAGGRLYMQGGVISGGDAKVGGGGNIFIRDNTYGTVEIAGGKVIGGTAATGDNICVNGTAANGSQLILSGGEISGDIYTGNYVSITLTGAPKVRTAGISDTAGNPVAAKKGGLMVTENSNIDISQLTTGASVELTGDINTAFTAAHENAANVARCFTCTAEGRKIVAENNRLVIAAKVVLEPEQDVFAPWDCNDMAYCPACMAQGKTQQPVSWKAFNPDTHVAGTALSGHYYLDCAVVDSTATSAAYIVPSGTLCLNLNGKDLTVTNGRVFFGDNKSGTLNVMDTAPTYGTVSGYYTSAGGAVFHLSGGRGGAKVNIYGGRFTKTSKAAAANSNRSSVVHITANGGTVNMYGGVIDTTGVENTIFPTAVYLSGGIYDATNAPWSAEAKFVMHDGLITGGSCTGDGGLIRVGNPDIANSTGKVVYVGAATFTMNGGLIYGGLSITGGIGTVLNGGNIYVGNDNKLILNGGIVGGDILTEDRTSVTAEGQEELYPGKTTVTLSGDVKILRRYEATKTKATGLFIGKDVQVNIDGLTENAEIYIDGALDVPLIVSEKAQQLKNYIHAYHDDRYVGIENGAFYLGQRVAAVQTAGEQVFYATVSDALERYYADPQGAYVQLYIDTDITLKGDAYIDSCGNDVTVSGKGTLYALDSANDTYRYSAVGTWTISGVSVATDVINPVNGRRYIALKEAGKPQYTAHRVELYMTHASLNTQQAGFYYKAAYKCDNALAQRVADYGVVLSVHGVPRQDSFLGGDDQFSVLEAPFKPDSTHMVTGDSTQLFGIFKDQEARPNAEYGATRIYATPYFTVDIDGDACYDQIVIGYVENAVYLQNNNVSYTSKSLLDVMQMIDEAWDNTEGFVLEDAQKQQVRAFYQKWNGLGMEKWAEVFEHIDA